MFFRDGTMENRVTITPFTVIESFFGATYRMEEKESIFATMKCCWEERGLTFMITNT